jgi:ssDNA-binding Zn-finger/Zn-ribbon topoisomerase 1
MKDKAKKHSNPKTISQKDKKNRKEKKTAGAPTGWYMLSCM